jgi:hypothetical protein
VSTTLVNASFQEQRIAATYQWFQTVVIGQKLCPFAPPLQKSPHLMRIVCCDIDTNRTKAIELVQQEALALVGETGSPTNKTHETTLVILDFETTGSNTTTDFRDFVRFSWDLQEQAVEQAGLLGKLQLVLFHPRATHQTYGTMEEDNPGDYTIRSPYPTVHLLREDDVLRAVEGGYPKLETLPARNQAKMKEQGLEVCRRRLAECYVQDVVQ